MAKGKNLNPADSFRKAERKKELKKNKAERQKARDLALVKKDTTSLEEDIERLEKAEKDNTISSAQKSELESLRAELARINTKKEEYVTEHPEHRRLVYRSNYKKTSESKEEQVSPTNKQRNVFDKNGLPRHPERSIYYDPVMNPYGVPPPGMPYMERPLRPDEIDTQEEDNDEELEDGTSDEEIVMPAGPPPSKLDSKDGDDGSNDDDDDEDDIPMPEGPPPGQMPPLPPGPPPLPPGPPPNFGSAFPPMPFIAEPPHLLPSSSHFQSSSSSFPGPPPLPPGFSIPQMPPFTPPGFTPVPRVQSVGSIQDPLAAYPHQPYQAYQSQRRQSHIPSNKPMKEITGAKISSAADNVDATVSAPAELRDLKRESTAFVPSSLKRRKRADGGVSKQVNAAPEEDGGSNKDINTQARPDLLDTLRSNLPSSMMKTSSG